MDPTRKKHPKSSSTPSSTSALSDPSAHKISNHFSRHKLHTSLKPNNPPPRVDTRLQAKAMTVSLIGADSSNAFIIKPNRKHAAPAAKMDAPPPAESKERLKKSPVKKEKEKKESQDRRDIKKLSSKEVNDINKVLKVAKEKESQQGHGHDIMRRPSFSLGRRRSFCCSQVELAGFLASTGVKVVSVDMPPFMQIHAVDCARNAYDSLEKFTSKTLAMTLKKEFDGVYGPAWHCIVGTSFGSFVTHSVGGFMYFAMDHKLYILLFKTAVQRAD
ncbi:hypothetical protein AAG906_001265 [Vitis piasezkii]